MPWLRGESWLAVVMTFSLPPWLTSQPHPEPNCLAVVSLKVFLKASKSPKSLLIWSARTPEGAPPPPDLGDAMMFQNMVWLEWPPPLLRTTLRMSSGTALRSLMRSSTDLAARLGWLASAAFTLVM